MPVVTVADDMYKLKIGEVFSYRGRNYVFFTLAGGTIARDYETFIVCPCKQGGRVTIKLPANN